MPYLKVFLGFVCFMWSCRMATGQHLFFSANDDNSAFLCEDGKVFLTGENNTGQLGIGSLIPSNIPVEVTGIPRCKQVSLEGVSTFLALTNSGDTILSWGPNDYGQVGDGTTERRTAPVFVSGVGGAGILSGIKQIATGNITGYALTNEGKVVAWGYNLNGQAGNGNFTEHHLSPVYVLKAPGDTLKNVKSISAGGTFCLALLCDGTVWAWGKNHVGQLGQNHKTDSPYALPVKNKPGTSILGNIKKIEASDNYSFALSEGDTLWVWGPNWDGRLGTGNYVDRMLPDYVRSSDGTAHLSGVLEIAGGQGHALALMSDHTVCAWGLNKYGQLGQNDTLASALPVKVRDGSGTGFLQNINEISVGDIHCIARSNTNELLVWGGNPLGQLGLNDHVNRWLPVLLTLPCEPVKTIFPGNGRMEYASSVCIDQNSGTIYIIHHHAAIVRWEESVDSFTSSSNIQNTSFSLSYQDLTQRTYYRALLNECSSYYYSPVAVIETDLPTEAGKVEVSANVRANHNYDTLQLTGHKGAVKHWEYSHDRFNSGYPLLNSTDSFWVYSDLRTTTYYKAYVQNGNCPAAYSEPAEIRVVEESAIKIYNGFTPNGDNINDEWIIDFIELFPDNQVEIYNRWGQLVYRVASYDNRNTVWQGENNVSDNKYLTEDTYYYLVSLGEGNTVMKGFVVISR